jgi:5-methylcytosine-specific restriction enzyme B
LRRDDSLFTPGRAIWSAHLLDVLDHRFIEQPDLRTHVGFEDKLRGQLRGPPADAIQLMGEILYLYYLPARWTIRGPMKRARVNEVLGWSPSPARPGLDVDARLVTITRPADTSEHHNRAANP